MNDPTAQLQSLGFTLPSPAYIFGAVLFGVIGMAGWYHGKKAGRTRTKVIAVALMFFPYAVYTTWLLYLVGAALCAVLVWDHRTGS